MITRRTTFAVAGATFAAPTLATSAKAQSFPSRPLRVVVPYAAGGPLDAVVRMVAERMATSLGQPITVENRGGGAGVVGADAVAKAPPDGYTLLGTVLDTQINNAALIPNLPYDPRRDFSFVSQLCFAPAIMVATPSLGARDLPGLDAALRGRPRGAYGSWGQGGLGHVMTETVNRRRGWGLEHTAYRGEAPMVLDVLAGQVALGMGSVANTMQHIGRGTLNAIAISGPARSPAVPEVPTFAEAGMADPVLATRIWLALLAPARVPAPVLDRLSGAAAAAVRSPEVSSWMTQRAFAPIGNGPAEFEANFGRDFEAITTLIRDFGITAPA